MLRGDPQNSMVLLKYLKHYSELLFSWGEKERAVEACKIVTNACKLLAKFSADDTNLGIASQHKQELQQAFFAKNFHSLLNPTVTKRDWLLSDFLLYSEHSLNYLYEVELRETKDRSEKIAANNQKTPRKTNSQNMRPHKISGFQAKPAVPNQDELLIKFQQQSEQIN